MMFLFVLDDSLNSKRLTTRTEELTKCYDPLQELLVRLWPCKYRFKLASKILNY